MLKTRRGSQVWLITQPAHAELSGRLAAHWGNEEFARPGHYEDSPDAERLRQEVVLGIAEHDNGWWEWEAAPPLSSGDGLPQGLGEVLQDPVAGMARWRVGIPRLSEEHPYASLLISDHAFWLYAAQFEADPPQEFIHHLQRGRHTYPEELETEARRFLEEIRDMQDGLRHQMSGDRLWQRALEPDLRHPHARLLQVLDSFSLALCSSVISPAEGPAKGLGEDHIVFHEVPRLSWEDRISVTLRPRGDRRIQVDPFPFDESPLVVSVPARLTTPGSDWRRAPWLLREYTLV